MQTLRFVNISDYILLLTKILAFPLLSKLKVWLSVCVIFISLHLYFAILILLVFEEL